MRQDWLSLFIIFSIATLIMLPMFIHGFPNADDTAIHYRRATDFVLAMREGALYPRWLPNSNFGGGSPAMLYYPPLPYYAVAFFNLFVKDTFLALTLSCWLGLLLSGLTMYRFARTHLTPKISLLPALLYMIAPYHIFDLYHRAALTEYWSFVWLPLVLDATYRVASGRGLRAVIYLAAAYALSLLTHMTITFEISVLLPVYILLLTRKPRRLAQIAGGVALGILMSSIFLIPLLTEVDYIRFDRALRVHYEDFFLFEHLGRAFSWNVFPPPEERKFYYLDGVNLAALGLLVLFLLSTIVFRRKWQKLKESPANFAMIKGVWVITAISLLMTSRLTDPLWRVIPQLQYVQYPLRWLTVTTASATMLTGLAIAILIRNVKLNRVYMVAMTIGLIANVAISSYAIARTAYNRQEADASLTGTEVAEYRTIWLDRQKHLDEFEKPAVSVIEGDAAISAVDDRGSKQTYEVKAGSESTITMRTLYFPGWAARINDKPVALSPGKEGNIQLTIVPGDYQLTLTFEDTKPRNLGKWASLLGLVVFLALAWQARRTRG
jgi:uncharacterized membrane protein